MEDDWYEGICLELVVVIEYDRGASSRDGEKDLEYEGSVEVPEPYRDIISEVVSRYDGSLLRSSRKGVSSIALDRDLWCELSSTNLDRVRGRWWKVSMMLMH